MRMQPTKTGPHKNNKERYGKHHYFLNNLAFNCHKSKKHTNVVTQCIEIIGTQVFGVTKIIK
jgi:hypothetical protein